MTRKRRTRNFGDVIRAELAADQDLAKGVREAALHAQIARQVYRLREEANLTQTQLADLIVTKQSVISRIEDADYDGHSLAILLRIAFALKKELKVSFCDPPIQCETEVTEEVTEKFPIKWDSIAAWHPTITNIPGNGQGLPEALTAEYQDRGVSRIQQLLEGGSRSLSVV